MNGVGLKDEENDGTCINRFMLVTLTALENNQPATVDLVSGTFGSYPLMQS